MQKTQLSTFHGDEYPQTPPASAYYHIISAPYEASVSYGGGTAQGPAALIAASTQLEAYLEGHGYPGEKGIFTQEPLSFTPEETAVQVMQKIGAAVTRALSCKAFPCLIGGEHSVSYGAVHAIKEYRKNATFGVLHFDAHPDLRDSYHDDPWSHASVMYRIAEEGIPIFQVGNRSFCKEDLAARKAFSVQSLDASAIYSLQTSGTDFSQLRLPEAFPEEVYISFDVDAFDASIMPATGTPEPGGLHWWQTMQLLNGLLKGRRVIGVDVVELAPVSPLFHCDYTAAKIMYTLMGFM